jgi:hypothetical protein
MVSLTERNFITYYLLSRKSVTVKRSKPSNPAWMYF